MNKSNKNKDNNLNKKKENKLKQYFNKDNKIIISNNRLLNKKKEIKQLS